MQTPKFQNFAPQMPPPCKVPPGVAALPPPSRRYWLNIPNAVYTATVLAIGGFLGTR